MTEKHRLGMALFILSEAVFFLLLIAAYVYFRAGINETPGTGIVSPSHMPNPAPLLDFGRVVVFSVVLWASSGTMWLAERSVRRDDRAGLRLWLAGTIALGAIFLYGEATEYVGLFARNVTISTGGLFGTTFFTMTGFHGLHVFVGLVLLSLTLGLSPAIEPAQRRTTAVDTVALYWHFVDVVWIGIFSVVYLWAFL